MGIPSVLKHSSGNAPFQAGNFLGEEVVENMVKLPVGTGFPKFWTKVNKWVVKWILAYPIIPYSRSSFVFYLEQEESLRDLVILYSHHYFPFTGKQLCTLTYEMVVRDKEKGFSPVKLQAGRYWLRGFYKRHKEVRKKCSVNLSITQVMAPNPIQISIFFTQYKDWVDQWGLEYLPNSIRNMDESGVGADPKPTGVVGVTGERYFQTVSRQKLTNTTIFSYVSAGQMAMHPLVTFKAAKIKPEWRKTAPSGYMIKGSWTGYSNIKLFQEYGE